MKKPTLVTRICITDSLKSMGVGETLKIKNTQAKASTVRTAIARLNKNGYSFSSSEAGRIDSVLVTRIK